MAATTKLASVALTSGVQAGGAGGTGHLLRRNA